MKIAGIVFVVVSTVSIGLYFSHAVHVRCELIGQLIIALRLLKSEIFSHGTPLPEAFGTIAAATNDCTADYFSGAAKAMNQKPWISPSESLRMSEIHLSQIAENDPVRQILRDFSAGIGRFDLDNQLQCIESAIARLEALHYTAEQDKTVRCRTYRTLGLCAGLALVILLI